MAQAVSIPTRFITTNSEIAFILAESARGHGRVAARARLVNEADA